MQPEQGRRLEPKPLREGRSLSPDQRALADGLRRLGAIKFGKFTLTSGAESSYYLDVKLALTEPGFLSLIADQMLQYVAGHQRIAGMELGAVPLVVALSLKRKIPYVVIRKSVRGHGTGREIEGELGQGENVLVVEDVATTGGSLRTTIRAVREWGGVVDKAVCVIDREEGAVRRLMEVGVELIPLLTATNLLAPQ